MIGLFSDFVGYIFSPRQFVIQRIKLPLAKFIYDTVELYKKRTKSGVSGVRDVLFRGTVVAFITALIVWLSIFMYIAFYYAYVPTISYERPVHLKFRSCEKWDIHRSLCSFPSGNIEINQKLQLLMSGQPYRVFLDLEMPESPVNKKLGMFMVCADFYGKDGKVISQSCRSAMLHYRSTVLDLANKFVFSPFFLFGTMEEKQNVRVELYSSYQDSEDQRVADIFIEVQTRQVEIYSAKFTINANFEGLRYVMFHWPVLSAAIGITSNLFFIAVVSMMSWYQIINSDEYSHYVKLEQEQKILVKSSLEDSSDDEVSVIGSEEFSSMKDVKGKFEKFK